MSQDVNKELLRCPFCGSRAITSTYYIECEGCEVAPKIDWFHGDKQKAISAWNQRPQAQASGEVLSIINTKLVSLKQNREYLERSGVARLIEQTDYAIVTVECILKSILALSNPPATQSVKQFLQGVPSDELVYLIREKANIKYDIFKNTEEVATAVIEHLIQLAGEK